ncbi:hypothetical protein GYMLUDRAFT_40156 [Collybiopsis luxurians FD-317 M1]|uniref:CHAT domain-containing protein n=1 Tax=Collybiopsis luxurians FD-317 M1 TaxID=944289 RepID=A0A0D0CW29_9AGAR|nr:hypothetical protein GYMLUDRAFT_40156 [Collybiopsis luxurians FD-317 M1]
MSNETGLAIYTGPPGDDNPPRRKKPNRRVWTHDLDPSKRTVGETSSAEEIETGKSEDQPKEASDRQSKESAPLNPELNSQNPKDLTDSGINYYYRYKRSQNPNDLDDAILLLEKAVTLTPRNEPMDAYKRLTNLGTCLTLRFKSNRNLSDVDNAAKVHQQAASHLPDWHRAKGVCFTNLGAALVARYAFLGEFSDLEKAMSAYETALALPLHDDDKVMCLNNFSNALGYNFERLGRLGDIDKAILLVEQAVKLSENSKNDLSTCLDNLGGQLMRRFSASMTKSDDIDRAIEVQKQALSLLPVGHLSRPQRLTSLGVSYQKRFYWGGEVADIDEAVTMAEDSVALTPKVDPLRPERLHNLGAALHSRFKYLNNIEDIERSISSHEQAISGLPPQHRDRPAFLYNLGNAWFSRFEHLGELEDVDKAVDYHRQSISLGPQDAPIIPKHLIHLANSLQRRFQLRGHLPDIKEAIELAERSLPLTSVNHASRPEHLNTLAMCLVNRFEANRDNQDLERAIILLEEATDLIPKDHTLISLYFSNLGMTYAFRREISEDANDAERAIDAYRIAATSSTGNTSRRFQAAIEWAKLMEPIQKHAAQLIDAHSIVINLIPRVVWFGTTVAKRYKEILSIGNVVSAAVAAAISQGKYDLALEWLEQGRSIVWGQIMQLRTPVDDLRLVAPELTQRLLNTSKGLEERSTSGAEIETESMIRRRAAGKWDSLIEEVRQIPSFEGFMKPRTISDLVKVARSGPVAVINIHSTRCDALIVQEDTSSVKHIALPSLSRQKLVSLWESFRSVLESSGARAIRVSQPEGKNVGTVLSVLWSQVVEPILDNLGYTKLKQSTTQEQTRLPHITWCATGPLAFLPLHAAGIYDKNSQSKAFQYVVSSYTPTLTALLDVNGSKTGSPNTGILAISQPHTPGQSPITSTIEEVEKIKAYADLDPTKWKWFNDKEATTEAVLHAMENYGWVHFASHATQFLGDPRKSAFYLYDGVLSLGEIMAKSFRNGEFAFLSACETAAGDGELPDEAIHLAAGMIMAGYQSVIATLWSVKDADAPLVADVVYSKLLKKDRGSINGQAAFALHEAVACLRKERGEKAFERWVPFVHMGC